MISRIAAAALALFLCPSLAWTCDELLRTYPQECEIQDRFRALKQEFSELTVDIDRIQQYRALRFIDAKSFAAAEAKETPIAQIYSPAPKTWEVWSQGERLSARANIRAFSLEFLRELHKESISKDLMTLWSRLKGAEPGKIRSKFWQLPPAFYVSCNYEQTEEDLHPFTDFDITGVSEKKLIEGHFSDCLDPPTPFVQGWVLYPSSESVPEELAHWIKTVNETWRQFQAGERPGVTPLEFIAHAQRWFVAIHPFGDGNGRVSRFIQDILLRYFDLPYVFSGKLQKDIQTSSASYGAAFISVEKETLQFLERCLDEHKNSTPTYACREIKENSP